MLLDFQLSDIIRDFANITPPSVRSAKDYIIADSIAIAKQSDESAILINRLVGMMFDSKEYELEQPEPPVELPKEQPALPKGHVQIYIDNSNISAGLSNINPRELHKVITGGKHMGFGLIVGSFPDISNSYWREWESLGYIVKVAPSGAEYSVDEVLHANILTGLFKRPNTDFVIVTGDGNNNGGLSNFPTCIEAILKASEKLKIDQHSWRFRCNSVFTGIRNQYKDRYNIHNLDSSKGLILA